MTDIAVIGAGPAGMTAGIYAMRSGFSIKVFESAVYGGQMVNTPEVENYPSLKSISGWELSQNMYEQLRALGGDVFFETVTSVTKQDGVFAITTAEGKSEARCVIIANGVKRRKLGVPGEDSFAGRGVSYCATCDGSFFRGKVTAVVGGGNTALEDALYLANVCEKVYLIHRRDSFRGEKNLADRVKARENIDIIYNAVPEEIYGSAKVEGIRLRDKISGETEDVAVSGVFIAVGLQPENEIFSGLTELSNGYIKAGENTATDCPGLFAAGDTRTKGVRQIVTAASDGAVAASAAAEYLNSLN